MFGVEGRYAAALYSAASKQKQLDAVEKELVKFKVCYLVCHSYVTNLGTLHFGALIKLL